MGRWLGLGARACLCTQTGAPTPSDCGVAQSRSVLIFLNNLRSPSGGAGENIPMTRVQELSVALLWFALCALVHAQNIAASPALCTAASLGQTEEVKQLLAIGADIEDKAGEQEATPLHHAAAGGHEAAVRLLLERGAEKSSKTTVGETPLHLAVFNGHEAVSRLLIERGADVSSKTNEGATPLYFAASEGFEEVIRLLLEHGADVSATATGGVTPLHASAYQGSVTAARVLIEHGADVSANTILRWTPLHGAAASGREAMARLLLAHGAELAAKEKTGMTPEDVAMASSEHGVAAMLRAEAARRAQGMADPRARVQEEERLLRKEQVAYPPVSRKGTIAGSLQVSRPFFFVRSGHIPPRNLGRDISTRLKVRCQGRNWSENCPSSWLKWTSKSPFRLLTPTSVTDRGISFPFFSQSGEALQVQGQFPQKRRGEISISVLNGPGRA